MTRFILSIAAFALAISAQSSLAAAHDDAQWSIAIHGGAGTILRENITPEEEAAHEAALQAALDAGAAVLADGGSAMDAIEAAILLLEDDPKFNAGRGAVYTWEGTNELDASIMDGRDRSAGAVTGVTMVKNPILLARAVKDDGRHVFLSGAGAQTFAQENGIELIDPSWFATEQRKKALERVKAEQLSSLDVDHKFGTVGAVALDTHGNLAAGTSTGGMTGKRWGRIGDSPVIGAGTYVDNRSCAVSATGWGEYFIRVGVARNICSRISMLEEAPQVASDAVMAEVAELGGDGGVIVVTPAGDAVFSFNTPGMYRGRKTSGGIDEVAIFEADASAQD